MNEVEAKDVLERLRMDGGMATSLNRLIESIDNGNGVSIHDNRNSGVAVASTELRDAISLCLKMEIQRVSARIAENRERVANWK